MQSFMEALREQRWDDHRFYHHSRINQLLHLISSLTFIAVYFMLFTSPVAGVLLGWLFGWTIRQAGHFFFEPKGYDETSDTTHEHRERIKIGYNLERKIILASCFALAPVVLYFQPSLLGLFEPWNDWGTFLSSLAYLWLGLAVGAVLFRTVHLFFLYDVQTGLVWATKIVTDPFHDVALYWKSPIHLMRGQMYDYEEYEDGAREQVAA